MSGFLVSSYSLTAAPRSAVSRAQHELRIAQKEMATGRLADVGLTLGLETSRTLSMRAEKDLVDSYRTTNSLLLQRFSLMQNSLGTVADTAQQFLDSLIANGSSDTAMRVNVAAAQEGLEQLVGAMNTGSGSRYLFSGAATESKAMAFTSTGGGAASGYADNSTASQATRDALADFMAANGIATVSDMTGDQVDQFLDNEFAALFNDANWRANWSDAEGTPVYNAINQAESVNVSYGADHQAFRQIAMSYVMLGDLDTGQMNEEARGRLLSRAIETLGGGLGGLISLRGEIGASEQRVEAANESLKIRSNILNISVAELEEVDPYEASTRVTNLTNLLETSYALTARISRLSLLNYL